MEIGSSEQPKVILIGGVGRTGTNILKDVLCDHPAVFGLHFETRITVDPDGLAPTLALLQTCWTPFVAQKAIERLELLLRCAGRRNFSDKAASLLEHLFPWWRRLRNLKVYKEWELGKHFPEYEKASQRLIEDLSAEIYGAAWPGGNSLSNRVLRVASYHDSRHVKNAAKLFLSTIYSGVLKKNEATVYVDDNTYNIFFADQLYDILPNSHLIHMIRDPREVALSYREQRWMPNDLGQCARLVKESFARWDDVKCRLVNSWYNEIRLEDLSCYPRSVINDIISRCELDAYLEFNLRRIKLPRSRLSEGDLSNSDRVMLDEVLGREIREYGYA